VSFFCNVCCVVNRVPFFCCSRAKRVPCFNCSRAATLLTRPSLTTHTHTHFTHTKHKTQGVLRPWWARFVGGSPGATWRRSWQSSSSASRLACGQRCGALLWFFFLFFLCALA
jgi:hypothetical protein